MNALIINFIRRDRNGKKYFMSPCFLLASSSLSRRIIDADGGSCFDFWRHSHCPLRDDCCARLWSMLRLHVLLSVSVKCSCEASCEWGANTKAVCEAAFKGTCCMFECSNLEVILTDSLLFHGFHVTSRIIFKLMSWHIWIFVNRL